MDTRIARITQMESRFNRLLQAVSLDLGLVKTDPKLCADLEVLLDYYENGLWLADYTADEEGLLPAGLLRGVLSQDGVYNLLFDLAQWERGENGEDL